MKVSLARFARPLLTVLFASALASLSSAQVVFTGVIEKATIPSFCQEETHILTCSGVRLKSSTLDLSKYEGINTKFTADSRGVTCTIYDVTAAEPPTATLVACGNPVPGCPMRFRVGPTGVIGQWLLFLAFDSAFVPMTAPLGSLQLATPIVFLAQGQTFGPTAALDVNLPNNLALSGLELHMQGLRQDIGPVGPLELTNAICFTILGPSPPCIQPGC